MQVNTLNEGAINRDTKKLNIHYLYNHFCNKIYDALNIIDKILQAFCIYKESNNSAEVHMNVYSLSLYIKSIIVANPQAIFFCFLINLFRELKENHRYYTISHSLTFYFLKVLERNGLVRIIEATKICSPGESDIQWYYNLINNKVSSKRKVPTYTISFTKNKNLKQANVELLRRLERFLHIPTDLIIYKEKNGALYVSINYSFITKERISNSIKKGEKKSLKNELPLS